MKRSWRGTASLVWLLTVAGAACAQGEPTSSGAAGASDAAAPHHGPPLVRVDPALTTTGRIATVTATRRALRGDLRVPAEVVPSERGAADIGSLIAGRIASIEVREGDAVRRGQVLAHVDSPEAARLAADLIRARARVLAASRKVERQLGLEQDRATSAAAVDEARMDLATAEADAAAARTLLSSLGMAEPPPPGRGVLAARVPIRSPIDGVVVERMMALGAPVAPEKTLFRVLARDSVVVDARWTAATPAPARDTKLKLLPRGGDGQVTCDGQVLSTLSMIDERTRARRIRIVPVGGCPFLVPGAYVDASFTTTSLPGVDAPALAIPKDAVVDVRGASTVFVARPPSGTFAAHAIRLGRATTEDVAIEDGVAEGDPVVVVGAILLKGELLRSELESQ